MSSLSNCLKAMTLLALKIKRLTSLNLSGAYTEQPGTRPPSCATLQQLPMYVTESSTSDVRC